STCASCTCSRSVSACRHRRRCRWRRWPACPCPTPSGSRPGEEPVGVWRGAPGPPGRPERWGVWGAISGPPMYLDRGVFDSIADGPPVAPLEPEPVVAVRAEAQEVGRTRHGGKAIAAEHLDGLGSLVGGEIELDGLRARREVGDDQQRLVAPRAQ